MIIESPSLVAHPAAQPNNGDKVRHDESTARAIAEALELLGEPVIGLLRLATRLLLGEISFSARLVEQLLGLLLALDASSLRLRLDFLLVKVGRDGADRGGVDVDEGRGRGCRGGDYLWRLRSGGLRMDGQSVLQSRSHWKHIAPVGPGGRTHLLGRLLGTL